jgi:hypothetical protein
MSLKDPVEESAKLVLDVYDYALDHNLDIKSKEDVKKILEELNPEHASNEAVEAIMPMLSVTDTLIKKDLTGRKKQSIN